jgi:uncharacterized membrane protein (UPF0127 family)
MRRTTSIALGMLLLVAACSAQVPDLGAAGTADITETPSTTTGADGVTTSAAASTTTIPLVIPSQLEGFATRSISIIDDDITYVLTVAVADTDAKRQQGLMNVADLGDLDGMLFLWQEPTTTSFWMKDTLLPLDIAFFDEAHALVDNFTMPPCQEATCPSYPAAGAYLNAVEVPESGFAALTAAARLILEE